MKAIKRMVASVITVAMMFSMVVPVSSATFTDVSGDAEVSVEKAASVGIIDGYGDGTFRPQGELKRSEAAKIMVEMLGLGSSAEAAENKQSRFTDVKAGAWYSGYIVVAESRGIVKGMGDSIFAPDAKVTNDQVITMMVRAIGAGPVADSAQNASWPDNYKNLAMDINLTEGINFGAGFAPATRGDMAKFVVNALQSKKWARQSGTNQGESTYVEIDELLMNDVLDVDMYKEAVLTATKTIDDTLDENEVEVDVIEGSTEINGEKATSSNDGKSTFELTEDINVDVDSLIGVSVDLWINSDDEITFIGKSEDADQEIVKFVEIDNISTDEITVILENEEEEDYDVADTYNVYLNRTKLPDGLQADGIDDDGDILDSEEGLDGYSADEEYIYGTLTLDRNGDVKNIIANLYNNAVVVEEIRYDEDDEELKIYHDDDVTTNLGGSNVIFNLDDTIIRDEYGKVVRYDEIEEGDLVLYTDNNVLVLKENTVEGTVERRSIDDVEIDNEEYKFNNGFVSISDFNIDDEVIIYLDANQKIVAMKELEGGTSDDYAIITEFYAADDISGKGSDFETTVELTLMDGTRVTKEFDLDETEDEFGYNSDVDDATNTFEELNELVSLAEYRADLTDLLGTMVKFETFDNGDKVKFLEFESRQATKEGNTGHDNENDIILADDDNQVDFELNGAEDQLRVKNADAAFIINEDTKVFVAKSETDTENGTLTDVEQIDWDALDGVTNLNAYFAEVDDRTDEVGYVFIPFAAVDTVAVNVTGVPNATENNDYEQTEQIYSIDTTDYIGIVADSYYEGNDDYTFRVIINGEDIDASTEMIYVNDSDTLDSDTAENKEYQGGLITVGKLGTVSDNDITVTKLTDLATDTDPNTEYKVAKATVLTSSKIKYKVEDDSTEHSDFLSSDIVFVEAEVYTNTLEKTVDGSIGNVSDNTFDNLVMGDEADIDTIDDSEDLTARGTLLWMVYDTDGEVTAIIYADSSTKDDVEDEIDPLFAMDSPTVQSATTTQTAATSSLSLANGTETTIVGLENGTTNELNGAYGNAISYAITATDNNSGSGTDEIVQVVASYNDTTDTLEIDIEWDSDHTGTGLPTVADLEAAVAGVDGFMIDTSAITGTADLDPVNDVVASTLFNGGEDSIVVDFDQDIDATTIDTTDLTTDFEISTVTNEAGTSSVSNDEVTLTVTTADTQVKGETLTVITTEVTNEYGMDVDGAGNTATIN